MAFYAIVGWDYVLHMTSQGDAELHVCWDYCYFMCSAEEWCISSQDIYGKQSSYLLAPEMGQQPLQPLDVLVRLEDYTGYRVCMDYTA